MTPLFLMELEKEYLRVQLNIISGLIIINIKSLIAINKTTEILSRGTLNLLSQLIKFNKRILKEKRGSFKKIMRGVIWPTRSFLSA